MKMLIFYINFIKKILQKENMTMNMTDQGTH